MYQLTDARKALNLWTGPAALSRALSTLLNILTELLLDSVLQETTLMLHLQELEVWTRWARKFFTLNICGIAIEKVDLLQKRGNGK